MTPAIFSSEKHFPCLEDLTGGEPGKNWTADNCSNFTSFFFCLFLKSQLIWETNPWQWKDRRIRFLKRFYDWQCCKGAHMEHRQKHMRANQQKWRIQPSRTHSNIVHRQAVNMCQRYKIHVHVCLRCRMFQGMNLNFVSWKCKRSTTA